MLKENSDCCVDKKIIVKGGNHCQGEWGAIYGLGIVGSLFYFLQGVSGFVAILTGIGKAFFWPAFVVYKVLGILGL